MALDPVEIRRIDDLELDQMRIIWNQHYESITSSKKQVTAEGLEGFRTANEGREYLGYFDIRRSAQYLLGFASIETDENRIFVSQMAVFEDVTRKGVGSALLRHLQRMADAEGKYLQLHVQVTNVRMADAEGKYLQLHVQVTNVTAVNFFLEHGFAIKDYSVEEGYVPEDYDASRKEDVIRLVEYRMEWRE
ncbi:MAG: GNAT family N-acetyltransferase [Candidatus Kariarchaeaceae archaeon]|jgi:ribosomal protein S18 acetylase RimI-like enzyme